MRIAIADDRREDAQELSALLERYRIQRQLDMEWVYFPSGEALLEQLTPGGYQLVFLDIYMGGMTGMETAWQIVRLDPACRLIFFTTSQTHAVESYEVHAAYYLTKPLEYGRLSQAMDVVCGALLRENQSITVRSRGIPLRAPLKEILYADCSAERTQLHMARQVLLLEDRYSKVAAVLEADRRFLICNRSVAVNMDWIEQVLAGEFLLKNGETVPIRQRGRAAVKKEFLTYSLRGLRREDRE